MKLLAHIVLAAVALNLSACAHKGGLKSPSQIAREDAKKAKKEADQQNADETISSPLEGEGQGGGQPTPTNPSAAPAPNPLPRGEGE